MVQNFKPMVISLVLISLFAFTFIQFGILFGSDNGAAVQIDDSEAINTTFSNTETKLEDFEDSSGAQRDSFTQETPETGSGEAGFTVPAIFNILSNFDDLAFGFFNLIFGGLADMLGIPTIVLTTLAGILLFSIIMLIWAVIRIGR